MLTVPSYNLSHLLSDADVLLVVPPFAKIDWPSLGLHILQACAKKAGFTVNVFYANLAMAAWISEETYQLIADTKLLGEAIFSRSAYNKKLSNPFEQIESVAIKERLTEIESKLDVWLANLTNEVFRNKYQVVGSTTSYDQINSSIALINYAKGINPNLITILGGANCQGDLGRGLLSLSDNIDYIFSGESEITFPKFLKDISMGRYPSEQIIHERLCNLNDIPVPDYDDYLRQLAFFMPDSSLNTEKKYYLSYETSRGCWWGQKHRCNFCGATTEMKYREKSPEKVISDLKYITSTFQTNRIIMSDLIMPHNYFNSLLPRLAKEFRNIRIFYEIKSNVTFEQLLLLKKAGIYGVQPGIETLSTSLLKKMNKGVTARQNISLLRNARTLDIKLSWVFIVKYPGDTEQEYEEISKLIPMIIHFNPPYAISPVLFLRFSPLFNFYEKFKIKKLLPDPKYQKCFPLDSIPKIAYYYTGEFNCYADSDQPYNKYF